jgi:predicted DsbA family dithiol-disulfide isomerase
VPAEPAADPIGAVDFHFDIMCPWAYQASLWIRDVREQSQRDLTAIAETFRPYLEARDWITIQKETP